MTCTMPTVDQWVHSLVNRGGVCTLRVLSTSVYFSQCLGLNNLLFPETWPKNRVGRSDFFSLTVLNYAN